MADRRSNPGRRVTDIIGGFLQVKNWREFQHYKHRNPPWIRLHRRMLDDKDFHKLPLASRALAPMLWLLASESVDGTIKWDVEEIAFRLRTTEQDVLDAITPLIATDFFAVLADDRQPASVMLAPCLQDATTETETETETDCTETSCSEPEKSPATEPQVSEPPAFTFPCVGQGPNVYGIMQVEIERWAEVFPGIDVLLELRKAREWVNAHPARRKTWRGMPKFVVGWLSRAQDKGRSNGNGQPRQSAFDRVAAEAGQAD